MSKRSVQVLALRARTEPRPRGDAPEAPLCAPCVHFMVTRCLDLLADLFQLGLASRRGRHPRVADLLPRC